MHLKALVKKCKSCGESDLNKLVKDSARPSGVRNECKECRNKSQRGGPKKNAHLKRTYGITLQDFNNMLDSQNHRCLICTRHRSELKNDLNVDHCHKTGKIRGLLCGNCNTALGNLRDSISLLDAAIRYLKIHG